MQEKPVRAQGKIGDPRAARGVFPLRDIEAAN
jgi:hypothetical protein